MKNQELYRAEKWVKGILKKKITVSTGMVVAFLISGFLGMSSVAKAEETAPATNSKAITSFKDIPTQKTSAGKMNWGSENIGDMMGNLENLNKAVNGFGFKKTGILMSQIAIEKIMKTDLYKNEKVQAAVFLMISKNNEKFEKLYGKDYKNSEKYKADMEFAKSLPDVSHNAMSDLTLYLPKVMDKADEVLAQVNTNTKALEAIHYDKDKNSLVLGNGEENIATGESSAILGGTKNKALGGKSTVVSGVENEAKSFKATVVGGWQNIASREYSFIGNGSQNKTTANYASVLNGKQNIANGYASSILGGTNNSTGASYSIVASGLKNNVSGNSSAILGGSTNTAAASYSVILNGYKNNLVGGMKNAILNGDNNALHGQHSIIANGKNNNIYANDSFIMGSKNNVGKAAEPVKPGEYFNFPTVQDKVFILGSENTVLTEGKITNPNGKVYLFGEKNNVTFKDQNADGKVYIFGSNVTANGVSNAVVFGDNSTAVENAISVGSAEKQRNIKFVKDGEVAEKSTDAINGSQLYKVAKGTSTDIDADAWKTKLGINDLATTASLEGYAKVDASNANVENWQSKLKIGTGTINGQLDGETVTGTTVKNYIEGKGFLTEAPEIPDVYFHVNTGDENQEAGNPETNFGKLTDKGGATGNYSTAIGHHVVASGQFSNSLGANNKATAMYAQAIGYGNMANSTGSIAIGNNNSVSNQISIAVGNTNQIEGEGSSTFGNQNYVNGAFGNIALGNENWIGGNANFASGGKNKIEATAAILTGFGNHTSSDLAIIYGTDNEISGRESIIIGQDINVSASYSGALGINKNGVKQEIGGEDSYSIGNNNSIMKGSNKNFILGNNVAIGEGIEGAVALGDSSTVEKGNTVSVGSGKQQRKIVFVGAGDISENSTDAINGSQLYKVAKGTSTDIDANKWKEKLGIKDVAAIDLTGNIEKDNKKAVSGGNIFTYLHKEKLALGAESYATGEQATAIGFTNKASHKGATAFGWTNEATAAGATAFGSKNTASGDIAVAFGRQNEALKNGAVAIGTMNTADGIYSVALGRSNTTKGLNSVAVGFTNKTNGEDASAFGKYNEANGFASSAFGYQNKVKGSTASAFGYKNKVDGKKSIALGRDNVINEGAEENFVLGNKVTIDSGITGAVVLGKQSTTGGSNTVSVGSSEQQRKIVFVGAGRIASDSSDAVNGSQLYKIAKGTSDDISADAWKTKLGINDLATTASLEGYAKVDASNANVENWQSKLKIGTGTINGQLDGETVTGTTVKNYIEGKGFLTEAPEIDLTGIIKKDNAKAVTGGTVYNYLHAEKLALGNNSIATGKDALALGVNSKATGKYSAAVGTPGREILNAATGDYSSAFGNQNSASAMYSSAFGTGNSASGLYSSAFGSKNIVEGPRSLAFGHSNKVYAEDGAAFGHKNTVGQYGQNQIAKFSSAFGYKNTVKGLESLALGNNITIGENIQGSVVLGHNSTVGENNVVSVGSENQQRKIVFVGAGDVSENSTDAINGSQLYKVAKGTSTDIDANHWKDILGISNLNTTPVNVDSYFHVNTGKENQEVGNPETNFGSISSKGGATGLHSIAIGLNSKATNEESTAIGNYNEATGKYSIAIGDNNGAEGENSVAMGLSNLASENGGIALGYYNGAFGKDSIAIGIGNRVEKNDSISVGHGNINLGEHNYAIGNKNIVEGTYSTAVGSRQHITGNNSGAFGVGALDNGVASLNKIQGDNSYSIGNFNYIATETTDNFILGNNSTIGLNTNHAVVLGDHSEDGGNYTVSVGSADKQRKIVFVGAGDVSENSTDAINGSQLYKVAKGTSDKIDTAKWKEILGVKNFSIAGKGYNSIAIGTGNDVTSPEGIGIGISNTVSGQYATALGRWNNSVGANSVTLGKNNFANGVDSVAVGSMNKVRNEAEASSAFGNENIVEGNYSVAVGYQNTAKGEHSAAVGTSSENLLNIAEGKYSSAFGSQNDAKGNYSSAFGYQNQALDGLSSAFGYKNIASGNSSVAFGKENKATNLGSVAMGSGNTNHAKLSAAIGFGNTIGEEGNAEKGKYSSAFGKGNTVLGVESIALGNDITIGEGINGAVVLGKGSTVSESNTVSVGSLGNTRKIVFVGAGDISENSTDAINGSQLYKLGQGNVDYINAENWKAKLGINDLATNASLENYAKKADLNNLAKTDASNIEVNTWKEKLGMYDKTEMDKKLEDISKQIKDVNGKLASGVEKLDIKEKNTIQELAQKSFQLEGDEDTGVVVEDITKQAQSRDTTPSLPIKKYKIKLKTDKFATKDELGKVKNAEDINVSKWQEKLGNGKIEEGNTGLVTGGTVYNYQQEQIKVDNSQNEMIAQNAKDIDKLDGRVKHVGALSAALAGLHPMHYDPQNPNQILAAMGAYKDKQAIAVGASHYFNENLLMTAGLSLGTENHDNEFMANVGLAYKFGSGEREKLDVPARYDGKQMASIYMMQSEMDKLAYENQEEKAKNEKLESEVDDLKARLERLEKLLRK